MDTTPKTEAQTTNAKVTPVPTAHEPRNFLVTFLLACTFGAIGLRHFYLGDKKLGWLRAGLFVGGYLLSFLALPFGQPALVLVGWLAISVASIWALVDFFYVYVAVKTDASGQPLAASDRDKKWAKGIFLATIGLFLLSFLAAISLIAIGRDQIMQRASESDSSLFDSNADQDYDSFLRELEKQQESQSY